MQRVRMSLPYFQTFDWEAEVVTVNENFNDVTKDELLLETIPQSIKVYKVKAFSKYYTSKVGLGSLAIRSIWFYLVKVNKLLKTNSYDLIYFSTTQFPVCVLGVYWKHKFGVPFVIDMQDPWHSIYYQNKPRREQPSKYWFSYRFNKFLEPLAMKKVDGLISVSKAYIKTLQHRYKETLRVPVSVITFGASEKDFVIARKNMSLLKSAFIRKEGQTHLVYVGRGGNDIQEALRILFTAFKKGLLEDPELFKRLNFHFLGTSYAPNGKGNATIKPLATEMGVLQFIEEKTDRISYFDGIKTLLDADGLIIPGSNDPEYTASKIFPYILAKKPLLAIFNPLSSASDILRECNAGSTVNLLDAEEAILNTYSFLLHLLRDPIYRNETNWDKFNSYSAENMTRRQCELFDLVIAENNQKMI